MNRNAVRLIPLVIAASIRCGDAPTQPRTPTPIPTATRAATPTPIPGAPLDLNGAWTGTLTYGTYFYGGGYASCPDESIRVQLYHGAGRISGNFVTNCAGTLFLEGTLGAQFGDRAPLTVDLWSAGEEKVAGSLEGDTSSRALDVSSRATTGATKLRLTR